ncbi:MAG TPA: hypothetical protein PK425_02600 [Syntrophales bacterium]|jgi:hypothetical protein|nr:hypothetical protein [Syntrophales bacterium]
MKKTTRILAGLVFLFLFLTCLSGCGKTGDPRPTQTAVSTVEKATQPAAAPAGKATQTEAATTEKATKPAAAPAGKVTKKAVKATKAPPMLSLDQSECGVILMWNFGKEKSVPEAVKIYRSDFNIAEGDCRDCPATRKLVAELSRGQLSYIREYDGSYVYFDKTVRKDFVYKYVMVVCGAKGLCSEPSEEAEIHFTYTMENCP